jgi:Ser/Thr protein kinase RdoA (MazF antagonist)
MESSQDSDDVRARLEKLKTYLGRHYGIKIVGLERLDRGVYRVDRSDGPTWVARIFRARRPIEQVEGDAEVLRFLEENDFPAERCACPNPVSTPGGSGVLVTRFVEGTPPDQSERTLRALGEVLGRLNTLPEGTGGVARDAGSLHHYSPAGGGPRREIDAAASWLDEVEDKVPAKNRAPFDLLRKQLVAADDCHGLPLALVHPDPVPKNVIAKPDGGLVMVDWTGAGRGPRLVPLALLIWASAAGKDGWSLDRVDPVVAGYCSRVSLGREELARLANVMRVRPLIFACRRYHHAMIAGEQPDGTEWWMPSEELVDSISARALSAFERELRK